MYILSLQHSICFPLTLLSIVPPCHSICFMLRLFLLVLLASRLQESETTRAVLTKNELLQQHLRNVSYDSSVSPTGNTGFRFQTMVDVHRIWGLDQFHKHVQMDIILEHVWHDPRLVGWDPQSGPESDLASPSAALFTPTIYYSPNVTLVGHQDQSLKHPVES